MRPLPRSMQSGTPVSSNGAARTPVTGEDRASAFLARAHKARANKLASGDAHTETHGQEHRMELARFRNVGNAARSAAHEGVVERPMDKNLSKILENKRAELRSRGTSVSRLSRHAEAEAAVGSLEEEEVPEKDRELVRPEEIAERVLHEANTREELLVKGSSVGKFKSAKKEMGLRDSFVVKPPDLGDMEI